jgi:hypothetical protein
MRALLDVNVLVALFDEAHIFNERAHAWLERNRQSGIATCPLTENGLVRILSHPRYSQIQHLSPAVIIARLARFCACSDHLFWADDVSLRDVDCFRADRISGSRQVTDSYLLALALQHGGRLVTLDHQIVVASVKDAQPEHLVVI